MHTAQLGSVRKTAMEAALVIGDRDEAIVAAVRSGIPYATVGRAAGLTSDSVKRIVARKAAA